jgi:hypothetical protein
MRQVGEPKPGSSLLAARERRKTRTTKADLRVGMRVKVMTPAQDFYFFRGETGEVEAIRDHDYLCIIVRFDQPRHFEGGYVQETFNFMPSDLAPLEKLVPCKPEEWATA